MTTWRGSPREFLPAAFVALIAACAGGKEPPKIPLSEFTLATGMEPASAAAGAHGEISAAAHAALDSGNAFFRAKRYAEALTQYRLAATHAPDDGAAFFGIYMVADATKNRPLADSAVVALRARGMMAPTGKHLVPDGSSK